MVHECSFKQHRRLFGIEPRCFGGRIQQNNWTMASRNERNFNTWQRLYNNTGGTYILKAPRSSSNEPQLLRLKVSNGVSADETVIYASADASNSLDNYDAPKYFNLAGSNQPEIYTQVDNEMLGINARKELVQGTEIVLYFNTEKENNFTILASEIKNFDAAMSVVLKDKQTKTEFELTPDKSYAFSSTATSSSDRFSVIIRPVNSISALHNTNKLTTQVYVNAANQISIATLEKCDYSIYSAVGQQVGQGIATAQTQTLAIKLQTGVYFVATIVNGKREIQKVIIR